MNPEYQWWENVSITGCPHCGVKLGQLSETASIHQHMSGDCVESHKLDKERFEWIDNGISWHLTLVAKKAAEPGFWEIFRRLLGLT